MPPGGAAEKAAHHVVAHLGLRTPDTNRDSFAVLESAGAMEGHLATRLQGWAGMRSILVHQYLAINHALTYEVIRESLGDLDEFVAWAANWMPD